MTTHDDDLLKTYDPSAGVDLRRLEDSIMRAVAGMPQGDADIVIVPPRFWRPAYLFAPGGGLIAAAVMGFLIGFSPVERAEMLLDPAFYSTQDIVAGDADLYDNGGIF